MNWLLSIAILTGVAASIEDLARRRVSNWIPVFALVAGVGYHSAMSGWRGGLAALGAAMTGFGVFLVFYCLGGMGGGDVKLMAGFGAVLGTWSRILEAALWAAAVGGILALAALALRGLRSILARDSPSPAAGGGSAQGAEAIPYAPAITLGAWLALVPKG